MGRRREDIDPLIINILNEKYDGLSDLINIDMKISQIDKNKETSHETSIFIWDSEGKDLEVTFQNYGTIEVIDGTIARVEKLDFDIIEAGKDYCTLYETIFDTIPRTVFFSAVREEDKYIVSEKRLAYVTKVLEILSTFDDDSLALHTKRLEEKFNRR